MLKDTIERPVCCVRHTYIHDAKIFKNEQVYNVRKKIYKRCHALKAKSPSVPGPFAGHLVLSSNQNTSRRRVSGDSHREYSRLNIKVKKKCTQHRCEYFRYFLNFTWRYKKWVTHA